MSQRLHVQVSLNGSVVEDRVVDVRRDVWLGARPESVVAFGGGEVAVRPGSGGLVLSTGERLVEGQPLIRTFGPVELRLEGVPEAAAPRDWGWLPDPILLVATAALVLMDVILVRFGGFP